MYSLPCWVRIVSAYLFENENEEGTFSWRVQTCVVFVLKHFFRHGGVTGYAGNRSHTKRLSATHTRSEDEDRCTFPWDFTESECTTPHSVNSEQVLEGRTEFQTADTTRQLNSSQLMSRII